MGNLKVPNVVGTLKFGCASAAEKFKNIIETNSSHDILDLINICRTLNANENCGYELHEYSSAHNNITKIVESTDDSTVFCLISGLREVNDTKHLIGSLEFDNIRIANLFLANLDITQKLTIADLINICQKAIKLWHNDYVSTTLYKLTISYSVDFIGDIVRDPFTDTRFCLLGS